MKFSNTILPAVAGVAQLATAQEFVIPQTERYVAQMLSKFHRYIHYHGPPHGDVPKHTAGPPASVIKAKVKAAAADPSCDFWLEDIKHRGVAAFNDFANYTVFRNVMDYGAKGMYTLKKLYV